jgi:16S rRNA (cytosine967-C5)-methyltransferase
MVLMAEHAKKTPHRNKRRDTTRTGNDQLGEQQGEYKPGLETRNAAVKILSAVIDKKTSLDGMLDAETGNPAYRALNAADRGLVRAIINTALRHLPRIEAALLMLLDNPLPSGARSLHHVLVVGVTQMLYLDVPDHSAVDLAVEQAHRDPRNRRFVKLVNALLRRLGREKDEIMVRIADVPVLPAWFFDRLVAAYGKEKAEQIAQAQLWPSTIDITVKSNPDTWAEKFGGQVLATGSVRLGSFEGQIPDLEGFTQGEWWVQDAAASMPVRLMGDIKGKRVVDLCAAPGGKTAQLVLAGAEVTALDQSGNRLKRLRGNLERLGFAANTVESNLLKFTADQPFDVVLLDAPCSSTGTLRKHPDVPWTKGPEDIEKLAGLQEKMLRHAITLVRPGGILVFSNCSLDPLEGEHMVARVLADTADVERVPVDKNQWPDLADAINRDGDLRTTPDMLGGTDGFFASVLRRK